MRFTTYGNSIQSVDRQWELKAAPEPSAESIDAIKDHHMMAFILYLCETEYDFICPCRAGVYMGVIDLVRLSIPDGKSVTKIQLVNIVKRLSKIASDMWDRAKDDRKRIDEHIY